MTATAFAFDPALDRFDDSDGTGFDGGPQRPQLRLIQGGGHGRSLPATGPLAPRVLAQARLSEALAQPAPTVEVYRRRRFLTLLAVTTLIVAIALAAGVSLTTFSSAPASVATDAAPLVHVVLPGDSYAAIAADLGASNPVVVGEQLRVANGGSELVIGQRLVVDRAVLAAAG